MTVVTPDQADKEARSGDIIQFCSASASLTFYICLPLSHQATVLEEMPPFPERESSILAKLKKKKPTAVEPTENKEHKMPAIQTSDGGNDGPALQVE